FFENYESLADITRADLFQRPGEQTEVFVRFSTVVGSKGSVDLARDVRGFATKFYTKQGNWDLVGNNIPVFFIQDAIKFPDLIHAVKPEPDHEMPQAASAHDTFWDFISLMPESMHMIMWVMSDRAIPRSLRMMEAFGVHTFRLVNAKGGSTFVKFPDFVHAVKPEPHNEMPQAASAHDTFWDFISLMPESMHMIMWVMSDRAIPRSYRMMEGFGVHTFRLINERSQSRFVKFHWKPILGVHSVVWDEAQKISGKDPDFHRRDLWDAIASGNFPEWELGVQIVEERDEHAFDFDLLDATKIIPEELVPVQRIGKLTLNRNPDNFFAETEQVAFHVGNIVPGIDFTNDPLMQGRLFSYLDTQLLRLGGPNFHEIPINRPIAPVHNLQRDGHMRQTINTGRVAYEPNTLGGGCPFQAGAADAGFASFAEKINGSKVRARSEKFFDHFTQALMFWRSQSDPEKEHIVQALQFELGKVTVPAVRERMVAMLNQVDGELAQRVAAGLGLKKIPKIDGPMNLSFPADGNPRDYQPKKANRDVAPSPAVSMANTVKDSIKTRQVAILVAEGSDGAAIARMEKALMAQGATTHLIGRHVGPFNTAQGGELNAEHSVLTASSVLFDAVYVPGGDAGVQALTNEPQAIEFVVDAFKHYKAIAASGAGTKLFDAAGITGARPHPEAGPDADPQAGVITGGDNQVARIATAFIAAIAQHRAWTRGLKPPIPMPA
ncbi:MAG: catalase, partial [Thermoanaerobaculia bacterium]|nr:catalase [Thermoanaerobaculia bacterium]